MPPGKTRTLLLLGSNIEPARHIRRARGILIVQYLIEATSKVYDGPAVGDLDGPRFQNQAIVLRGDEPVEELRTAFRKVEEDLGRVRTENVNGPRTIDIDVLARIDEAGAVTPEVPVSPDLLRFHHVVLPVLEILPNLVVPGDGRTVEEIARDLGPPPRDFRSLP